MPVGYRYPPKPVVFDKTGKAGQWKFGADSAVDMGCCGVGTDIAKNTATSGLNEIGIMDRALERPI
jgi:hypothetical protein